MLADFGVADFGTGFGFWVLGFDVACFGWFGLFVILGLVLVCGVCGCAWIFLVLSLGDCALWVCLFVVCIL